MFHAGNKKTLKESAHFWFKGHCNVVNSSVIQLPIFPFMNVHNLQVGLFRSNFLHDLGYICIIMWIRTAENLFYPQKSYLNFVLCWKSNQSYSSKCVLNGLLQLWLAVISCHQLSSAVILLFWNHSWCLLIPSDNFALIN